MNHKWVISSLRELAKSYRDILEDDAKNIIDEAIAGIRITKERYDEYKRRTDNPSLVPQPWGYQIDPDRPLRFRPSSALGSMRPQVEIYSTVLWQDEGNPPVTQNTHVRIWSASADHIFRTAFDAEDLFNMIGERGRVMWRCHFDLANTGQQGPQHHLQFGGNARDYELCWFPNEIDLPRLVCPPMDLVLVCQFIAANFFWKEYNEFRDTPEWMIALSRSQEHLLKNYYKACVDAISNHRSLLDTLWNV